MASEDDNEKKTTGRFTEIRLDHKAHHHLGWAYFLGSVVVSIVNGVARLVRSVPQVQKNEGKSTENTDIDGSVKRRIKVGDIRGFDGSPIEVGNVTVGDSCLVDPDGKIRSKVKVGEIRGRYDSPINIANFVGDGKNVALEVGDIRGRYKSPIGVGHISVPEGVVGDIESEVGDIIGFDKSGITAGLWITTECGKLQVSPGEIIVLPQGFRFSVDLPDGPSSGYVAEIFGAHFQLPDLGPIGANGLAASRDFLVPIAYFVQDPHPGYTIVQKFGGELFSAIQDFSPFNVVAWHGNYVPYKYDLSKFCPYNTVLIDHGDPSINTVLTAPTEKPGVALLDFVIFPPRWVVAEHTFRPPYYHRNCMSEFMGIIHGKYEARIDGFVPGGASLHSCMSAHGPDRNTYEGTLRRGNDVGPVKITDTMAFMFESSLMPRVSHWALESPQMDHDYYQCWIGLRSHFSSEQKRIDCNGDCPT